MPEPPEGLRLAEAMAERICHDLAGLSGTLLALSDLAAGGGADAETLADLLTTSREMARRLDVLRRVYAGGGERLAIAQLATLIAEAGLMRRATLDLDGVPQAATVPAAQARILLGVLLLGVEACRPTGTVVVAQQADGAVLVMLHGPGAAWPPALTAALSQGGAQASPSAVLARVVVATAHDSGVGLDLLLAGAPAIMVAPPR